MDTDSNPTMCYPMPIDPASPPFFAWAVLGTECQRASLNQTADLRAVAELDRLWWRAGVLLVRFAQAGLRVVGSALPPWVFEDASKAIASRTQRCLHDVMDALAASSLEEKLGGAFLWKAWCDDWRCVLGELESAEFWPGTDQPLDPREFMCDRARKYPEAFDEAVTLDAVTLLHEMGIACMALAHASSWVSEGGNALTPKQLRAAIAKEAERDGITGEVTDETLNAWAKAAGLETPSRGARGPHYTPEMVAKLASFAASSGCRSTLRDHASAVKRVSERFSRYRSRI